MTISLFMRKFLGGIAAVSACLAVGVIGLGLEYGFRQLANKDIQKESLIWLALVPLFALIFAFAALLQEKFTGNSQPKD